MAEKAQRTSWEMAPSPAASIDGDEASGSLFSEHMRPASYGQLFESLAASIEPSTRPSDGDTSSANASGSMFGVGSTRSTERTLRSFDRFRKRFLCSGDSLKQNSESPGPANSQSPFPTTARTAGPFGRGGDTGQMCPMFRPTLTHRTCRYVATSPGTATSRRRSIRRFSTDDPASPDTGHHREWPIPKPCAALRFCPGHDANRPTPITPTVVGTTYPQHPRSEMMMPTCVRMRSRASSMIWAWLRKVNQTAREPSLPSGRNTAAVRVLILLGARLRNWSGPARLSRCSLATQTAKR